MDLKLCQCAEISFGSVDEIICKRAFKSGNMPSKDDGMETNIADIVKECHMDQAAVPEVPLARSNIESVSKDTNQVFCDIGRTDLDVAFDGFSKVCVNKCQEKFKRIDRDHHKVNGLNKDTQAVTERNLPKR